MAATGYTPIQLYYSTTASATPVGTNLLSGELAINIQDEKLYFKNASGTVKLLASTASTAGLTVGTTTITSGTSGYVLYNNAGVLGNLANTGSGNNVLATSPTLVTPVLGTPSSGTLTSCTGLPLTTGVTGTLPIGNGGTNITTYTTGDVLYASATNTLSKLAIGTTGQVLTVAAGLPSWGAAATGTVTSVSVVSANGFAGTVATATTTPAITLTTSITGVLKGNGTAISAATAGTDYVAPGTATTFTAQQTFSGSTSVLSSVFSNSAEVATVSATAATGTINYDVTTQSVLYYTTNASANWTVNFRASSGTSLNTSLATGQSITVAFLVTQGATAYYNNAVTIDGTSVTPKWQGGSAPTSGNASSIDIYQYTIVKTANATYTVFASQTQFK